MTRSIAILAALLFLARADAAHTEPSPCMWTWTPDVAGSPRVQIDDVFTVASRFGAAEGDAAYVPSLDYDRDGAITLADIMPVAAQFGATPWAEVRIQDVTNIAGFELELEPGYEFDVSGTIVGQEPGSSLSVFQGDDRLAVVDLTVGAAESGSGLLVRLRGAVLGGTWLDDANNAAPLVGCLQATV